MKKILLVICMVLLVISLASCSKKTETVKVQHTAEIIRVELHAESRAFGYAKYHYHIYVWFEGEEKVFETRYGKYLVGDEYVFYIEVGE